MNRIRAGDEVILTYWGKPYGKVVQLEVPTPAPAEAIRDPYAFAAFLLANLGIHLKAARDLRGLSTRAASLEIGVHSSTVERIEEGGDASAETAAAILAWLALP